MVTSPAGRDSAAASERVGRGARSTLGQGRQDSIQAPLRRSCSAIFAKAVVAGRLELLRWCLQNTTSRSSCEHHRRRNARMAQQRRCPGERRRRERSREVTGSRMTAGRRALKACGSGGRCSTWRRAYQTKRERLQNTRDKENKKKRNTKAERPNQQTSPHQMRFQAAHTS
jgi:hypothetical protein